MSPGNAFYELEVIMEMCVKAWFAIVVYRVYGLRLRLQGLRCLGCRGFRASGLGFRYDGYSLRVQGSWFKVYG